MKTDSLQDLFIDELGDLYSAGSQVLKVLPKMAEAAIAPELRRLFQSQIIQARAQVERVETVAKTLGIEAISKRCRGMEGLVEETEEMIAERAASHARDAGLSLKALRMQHYLRAAGDGAARTYALLALETANPRGQTSGEDAMWTDLIELAKHNANETVH